MTKVYIGLGSNLDNPIEQVKQAQLSISQQIHFLESKASALYASPPMGPQDQPDYVNAVMSVKTPLSAIDVLRVLQRIENDFGRERKGDRWGARTLDLDLLLYGDQQINVPDLIVPHVGLSERAFVLYPLQDIAPQNLFIPGKGTLAELVSQCNLSGLEKIT